MDRTQRERIGRLQAKLLEVLDRSATTDDAKRELASLHPELGASDLDMVEVAMELVKKWGVRR